NKVSAVMAAYPELQGGTAQLNFEVSRQYIVNTEGTFVVQNRIAARVMITAQGMASDGMVLPVSFDYYATSLDKLPDVDVMIVKAKELVQRVKALMKAPVANPYTGPAILSGPASGVFFHEIFGHRLEAHRLKSGGETFRNMVGKNVLPSDFSVYCDPTLSYYRDKELNGHYLFDSEGVRSRRVDNIKNGVLNEFLLSRVPMDGFPQSNGHGRASDGHDAVSRQSSLIVETTAPQTEEKLREMLRAEAKKQGKEYGYYFLTVTGGFTTTGQGNTMNSFNVSPVEVYRVYVDGRPDELVHGVDLIGTPLSMFSHIAAAGNEPTLFTGSCGAESGWVPVACVSPQIYVTQIETQRRKKAQQTPQILAAPDNSLSPTSDLKEVMKKEVSRAADELNIRGAMQPLLVSSIANTSRTARIVGELGGISMNYLSPWTTTIGSEVTIGDIKQSSKVEADRYFSQVACVGEKVDANAVRRAVWNTTDNSYKDALNIYVQKQNYYTQHPLPLEYANTNDLILPAATS
ncbi:MAG: TldD/PmbA family protein, partial [Prevotella sp.]|nr:TldD/PmbA family protein [Prevotella sp.]